VLLEEPFIFPTAVLVGWSLYRSRYYRTVSLLMNVRSYWKSKKIWIVNVDVDLLPEVTQEI